ncbi:glycosyltransferase [Cellulomonas alba]|uniref:Glycosyltransferase n=1 Tax=Cellulomonas alba TaxID=3053467 RepID=A0ABT7SCW9_9CELL|nr:glycosyltransferase [Cellulomonas alba]MDM7854032.1 glycosyltransferase [Cellulomonas alba]
MSVIVATYLGAERIAGALRSLVNQSLDPGRFEVVVVSNGPEDGTPDVVRRFRAEHPEHDIRVVRTSRPGASNASNVGLASARHDYVTFVDDDDFVSRDFLAGLLAHAAPDVVVAAAFGDHVPGSRTVDFGGYLNRSVLRYAGSTVGFDELHHAASAHAGKLAPTRFARQVRFNPELASGYDVAYWSELFSRFGLDLRVVPLSAHAVYYRQLREGSASRTLSRRFVTERLIAIGVLDRLREEHPAYARTLSALASGQATHIGRYLRDHPDERHEVFAEIAERGLDEDFPYHSMNAHATTELVISYGFPPYQDTSAMVVARRIALADRPVDVLTHTMRGIRSVDERSLALVRRSVGRRMTVHGTPSFAGWAGIERFATEGMSRIAAREAELGAYESVYSRAMWPAAHVLGALCKARNPEVSWTAEFSDPLLHDAEGRVRESVVGPSEIFDEIEAACAARGVAPTTSRNLFEWLEKIAFALADRVVFTNVNQRAYMLEHTPARDTVERALEVSEISPHPTLPPEYYRLAPSGYRLDARKVNIGYFGVFYSVRGVGDLLAAIQGLSPDERRRVALHVFTDKPDETRAVVDAARVGDVVVVQPYIPYFEFLELSTHFDWLVVADARVAHTHGVNPYLPSKLSDYRGSGARIWGLVERGSVLDTLDLDAKTELGDVDAAREILRNTSSRVTA